MVKQGWRERRGKRGKDHLLPFPMEGNEVIIDSIEGRTTLTSLYGSKLIS